MADKSPPTAADLFQVIEMTRNQLFFCMQKMREYSIYSATAPALNNEFKALLLEFQELCALSEESTKEMVKHHLLIKLSQTS